MTRQWVRKKETGTTRHEVKIRRAASPKARRTAKSASIGTSYMVCQPGNEGASDECPSQRRL